MAMPTLKPKPKNITVEVLQSVEQQPIAESAVIPEPPRPTAPAIKAKAALPQIDFLAFKQKFIERTVRKPKPLFLLITGRRSSGKSASMGTCPGDLLLIHSRQEHHSYQTAISIAQMTGNKNAIVPFYFDQLEDGTQLEQAEKVWNHLSNTLDALIAMPNPAEVFPFVALDSLNSLERYTIKRDNVLKANQFNKSQESTANLMELVLEKLLPLNEKGVNIIVNMASEIKERPDGTLQLTPFLTGYRSADEVIGSFPDIAVVNCIQAENEQGDLQDYYVFQFKNAEGSKSGKRFSGEAVTTTFAPRLQSLPKHLLPTYIEANVGELIEFIKTTFDNLGKPQQQAQETAQ